MRQEPYKTGCAIMWFRHDLRLEDNPALTAAAARGAVLPVFIWAPEEEHPWPPGAASKWWLHQSLAALQADLGKVSSRLIIRSGKSAKVLQQLINESGASAVFWNRRYEPAVRLRDERVSDTLRAAGVEFASFNAALFNEPCTISNKSGKPFQVFTAYWRHCASLPAPGAPLPGPALLGPPERWPRSEKLEALHLEPVPNWAGEFTRTWRPGEAGANAQLRSFLSSGFEQYGTNRDRPALRGTSTLSPHLHFGEISPRQICSAVQQTQRRSSTPWRTSQFLTELGWREFAHYLLFHFPETTSEPLRPQFRTFRWHKNQEWLEAWQQGRTGYPLVDAGLRQLWRTGWMHNRVRMVVASFLVKDLLISWNEGARWFWDTLVDADLAQNTLGWQWSAGCGADSAPFFRIFNPVHQGQKFDPDGAYIRQWIPELSKLPGRWIHEPWKAPAEDLSRAEVSLGKTYPLPIVSHAIAREVALEAYNRLGRRSQA